MQGFKQFVLEAVQLPSEFEVVVQSKYIDQPTLAIPGWGSIRLFYSGSGDHPHWVVHMIEGHQPGAGTPLYFAALFWVLAHGDKALAKGRGNKPTYGWLASDSTLSPDAVRARLRMQSQYGDYLMIKPNPDADGIKVHKNDGTTWRRPATAEESSMWRLSKMPPFHFNFRA